MAGTLAGPRREVLYVSPLKALCNDVQQNLLEPLAGISERRLRRGAPRCPSSGSRSAPATRRRARGRPSLRRPPHILVTTPESLYILLTAEREPRAAGACATVIVDEIHAVARRQARRAPGALAGAARRPGAPAPPAAHRPVGDGRADRRGGAVPGRRGARRARRAPVAAPASRSTAASARPRRSRSRTSRSAPVAIDELWAEIYDRARRAHPRAPDHARLRQHPPARRACGARAWASGWARTPWPRTTAACRARAAARRRGRGSRPASCGPSWPRRRSSWASTSARWTWCARSARRARSPWRCSGSAARATGVRRHAQGPAASPPRATSWSSARRWCAPIRRGAARPPGDSRARRSTSWRSRSWRGRAPRPSGAKTSSSRWSGAPGPTATCRAREFDAVIDDAVRGHRDRARPRRRRLPAPRRA